MSTTAQHTPGPWVVLSDNGYYDIADDSGENYVCGCEGIDNEANARLIAAAPELLEALQSVIEWIDRSENWWIECPSKGGIDAESIRAAIARATGKEQA